MPRTRFTVPGKELVEKVKQLVSRRDVRRVCLIDEENNVLEVPVTFGDTAAPASVIGAPILAAIGAFATLVNRCTVEVETVDDESKT